MTLPIGSRAPEFTAQDADGNDIRLSDLRSQWVLLFFYPKDFTSGCTAEACSLNDSFGHFEASGATVVGINTQDQPSHQKFRQKHALKYPLVADTDRSVGDAYDVPRRGTPESPTSSRVSFLIDPEGKIAEVWNKVTPATHTDQVLKALSSHQPRAK